MVKQSKKVSKNGSDSLTRLVVKEFGRVHEQFKYMHGQFTKIDQEFVQVKSKFKQIEEKQDLQFKIVTDEISRINDNVKDIKMTLGPVPVMLGSRDREIEDFKARLSRVERKVGIEK